MYEGAHSTKKTIRLYDVRMQQHRKQRYMKEEKLSLILTVHLK